jgi:hypothetical protein
MKASSLGTIAIIALKSSANANTVFSFLLIAASFVGFTKLTFR